MKPIDQMLKQLSGMLGTDDLTDWEHEFLESVIDKVKANNGDTTKLTAKQADIIDRLHSKHFA